MRRINLKNVILSVRNGTFVKKCMNRCNFYKVRNNNIKKQIEEYEVYLKYKNKYRDIVSKGVICEEAQEHSDYIWICWLQGEKNAPELIKACINSWKINMPEKKIVILTEKTIADYVNFPDYILEKRKKGIISNAHFSDLLRISLLCKYGGMWCDATLLCTSAPPKFMTDDKLFVFKLMDLSRLDVQPIVCSNWYISAWSNQKILLLCRDLLFRYWRDSDRLENYFIFHIIFTIATERYCEEWKQIPFYNNNSPHTLQFELDQKYNDERWRQIYDISPIHKLNHHNDYSGCQGSFYKKIIENYLPQEDGEQI